MALAPEQTGIGIRRHFSTEGVDPYDEVTWERRDARITNYRDGTVAFEQLGVEFPVGWSQNATNIVAQKYFRGTLGSPEREWSLKQVINRVVSTVTAWGRRDGYFVDGAEADAFRDELTTLLLHQRAAFNSPVWFNIGVPGRTAAGFRVLHPRRRGHDAVDPQLVHRGRDHLPGRVGVGRQPVQHPVVLRAPQGRRHRVRAGELHAGRRRVGRHDQVRGQDPAGGQDGHPQRRPPRRRGLHLVQGGRGAQGPGPARQRVRHGPRRQGQPLHPVPERQQLGPGHRRVHAGRRRRRRLAPAGRHHRRARPHGQGPRPLPPDRGGGLGVRRPRHAVRHHHQQVAHRVQHRPHQRVQPLLLHRRHAGRHVVGPRPHRAAPEDGRRRPGPAAGLVFRRDDR